MKKNLFFFFLITNITFSQNSNLLDTSFGTDGKTNFAFYNGNDLLTGVQLWHAEKLDDNKILAFGYTENGCHGSTIEVGGIVVRFNQNGTLDTTFNDGIGYKIFPGKYFRSVKKSNDSKYYARSNNSIIDKLVLETNDINLATDFTTYAPLDAIYDTYVLPDNKLYVLKSVTLNSVLNVALVRLQSDGSLDATFGTNGQVVLGNVKKYRNIALKNGAIYLSGTIVSTPSYENIVISKLNLDGTFDTAFGTNGSYQTPSYYLNVKPEIYVFDDGKISGFAAKSNSPSGLVQFQLLPNGTLNPSYFNNGIGVITATGVYEENSSITLHRLDDDSIIVSGSANNPESFNAVKINSDGNLDQTFGTNGIIVSNPMSPNYPYTGSYPHYNNSSLIYGESIVFVGMFWEWNCASTKYVSQLTKYVFNETALSNDKFDLTDKFYVYPNPVKDILYLSASANIEIVDIFGKILMKSENVSEVNISNLSAGVYFAKVISNNNKNQTFKFIKQ